MPAGQQTFADLGGAVSDLFAGIGASTAANLKAQGIDIEAQGTQISAQAALLQSQGDIAEGTEYGLAKTLAEQNAAYTATSTAIQAAQQDRQTTMTIGGQKAAVGGAGLAESGSSLDLLRDSASQGALARAALVTNGQMTEAGYTEQAASYGVMKNAANATAAGEVSIAGQEDTIATEQQQLATQTAAAGQTSEIGDFAAGLLKGAAAVATIATGGAAAPFIGISDLADPTVAGTLY
jgi:hypothetical protein